MWHLANSRCSKCDAKQTLGVRNVALISLGRVFQWRALVANLKCDKCGAYSSQTAYRISVRRLHFLKTSHATYSQTKNKKQDIHSKMVIVQCHWSSTALLLSSKSMIHSLSVHLHWREVQVNKMKHSPWSQKQAQQVLLLKLQKVKRACESSSILHMLASSHTFILYHSLLSVRRR